MAQHKEERKRNAKVGSLVLKFIDYRSPTMVNAEKISMVGNKLHQKLEQSW